MKTEFAGNPRPDSGWSHLEREIIQILFLILRKLFFARSFAHIPLRGLENPKAFGKIGAAIGDQGKGEGGQDG